MMLPRLVGINHVALEVGNIDEALNFYGRYFAFTLRGRSSDHAFIDIGDQFIALARGPHRDYDSRRHFGLVVDDKERVRRLLQDSGITVRPRGGLDFTDPWGNSVQVVDYREVQFTKAPWVLRGLGFEYLRKDRAALEELGEKGLAPDEPDENEAVYR